MKKNGVPWQEVPDSNCEQQNITPLRCAAPTITITGYSLQNSRNRAKGARCEFTGAGARPAQRSKLDPTVLSQGYTLGHTWLGLRSLPGEGATIPRAPWRAGFMSIGRPALQGCIVRAAGTKIRFARGPRRTYRPLSSCGSVAILRQSHRRIQ